ncbi:MAG TPA: pyridoxal-dependent decarboxylase [Clostridiales bacterium]|nr:pyridoxal-dependent decarboxylase [Clostridiales bacterium]
MNNQEMFIKENAPCYIYNNEQIIAQCRKLKEALFAFDFLYSIKTNPFAPVIQSIAGEGFGADAASSQEVELSIKSGMAPQDILFSSPGKTADDISQCFEKCIIIADSFSEIKIIDDEAKKRNQDIKIGIRINPDFSMDSDIGTPSKFGIDMEQADELEILLQSCDNIIISGIHIHIKSQILDVKKLGDYYHNCFNAAKKLNKLENIKIEFINFGSGIGALYNMERDVPVNLDELSDIVNSIVSENAETMKAKLYIETGRFVVCNAGTYYTEIVDIKQSRGKKYLIVKNGMNGFMRPAIASLLQKATGNSEFPGQEPLFTSYNAFGLNVLNKSSQKEKVTVVGNLCTALDVIKEDVELNKALVGDIISVSNAGSYAYSLSPLIFSSHPLPSQFLLCEDGEMKNE